MSDIILYGKGKTGQSLKKMTERLGKTSVFFDDTNGFDCDCDFDKNSLVVVSPGVKPDAEGMLRARKAGAVIMGELEYCFSFCKGKCVSVTGTNGKTTVCQMIHFILQQVGKASRLLGNGGVPLSSQVLDVAPDEIVVLESSSFQLQNVEHFSPYISVITNVAADHLDYHGSFENYVQAKSNNFRHQNSESLSVFNADDALALQISFDSPSLTYYYSVSNRNANCYYNKGTVFLNVFGRQESFPCVYLSCLAKHNLSNALCAILTSRLLGVSIEQSCRAIELYKLLPHRLQPLTTYNGVTFVDDSKATNVHATVSALHCYENTPLTLILGGSDKDCVFDEIFSEAKSNVKLICAVGQTAEKISLTAKKYFWNVKICSDYKQALRTCYGKIKNVGGVVLMSNACASFDMFESYAQRGDYFANLVEELCREEKKV